jgi:hypothetical protein
LFSVLSADVQITLMYRQNMQLLASVGSIRFSLVKIFGTVWFGKSPVRTTTTLRETMSFFASHPLHCITSAALYHIRCIVTSRSRMGTGYPKYTVTAHADRIIECRASVCLSVGRTFNPHAWRSRTIFIAEYLLSEATSLFLPWTLFIIETPSCSNEAFVG